MEQQVTDPQLVAETERVVQCSSCAEAALTCCPRCRRAFCEQHAAVVGCCGDCELEMARRTRKVLLIAMPMVMALLVAMVLLLARVATELAFFTGFASIFFALALAGGLRAIVRRGSRGGWILLPRQVQIAADGGDAKLARYGRKRERCMYKSAYKAGMNRQGGV